MKIAVTILLAVIAIVAADVSHLSLGTNELSSSSSESVNREYLPPTKGEQASASVNREYLPPLQPDASEPAPAHSFGPDGYKYKTPAIAFRF